MLTNSFIDVHNSPNPLKLILISAINTTFIYSTKVKKNHHFFWLFLQNENY